MLSNTSLEELQQKDKVRDQSIIQQLRLVPFAFAYGWDLVKNMQEFWFLVKLQETGSKLNPPELKISKK